MPVLTVNIAGVELVRAGTHQSARGPVTFTRADLADMVTNSRVPHVDRAPIKLGHVDDRFNNPDQTPRDGEPLLGHVTNLRVSEDGNTLVGDLVGVPSSFADRLATAYPSRSVEVSWGMPAPDGQRLGAVLTGLAMLGATPPAVKGMADVYAATASGDEDTTVERSACLTASNTDLADVRDTSGVPHTPPVPDDAAAIEQDPTTTREEHTMAKTTAAASAAAPGTTPAVTEQTPTTTPPAPAATTTETPTETGQESDNSGENTATTEVTETTEPATASASGPEVVTITKAALAALQDGANAGVAAMAELDKQRRDGIITAAMSAGKLTASEAQVWRNSLDTDEPGTVALLATLAANTIPVAALGHADLSAADDTAIDEAITAHLGL